MSWIYTTEQTNFSNVVFACVDFFYFNNGILIYVVLAMKDIMQAQKSRGKKKNKFKYLFH